MVNWRRWALVALGAVAAAVGGRAAADVRCYPSSPWIERFGDRIVFLSVDRQRVVCIDRQRRLLWQKESTTPLIPQRGPGGALWLQDSNTLLHVDVGTGSVTRRERLLNDLIVAVDPDSGLAYACGRRFDHRLFAVLDAQTFTPRWGRSGMESLVASADDHIFVVGATRTYEDQGHSYSLGHAAIVALDRTSGHELWRRALKDRQADSARGFWRPPHLVALDSAHPVTELLVLDGATGAVVAQQVSENPDAPHVTGDWATHVITDVQMDGDALVMLVTSRCGMPCDRGELRWCALPSLAVRRTVTIESKEILRFWLLGDYVLTSGIYELACFSRDTGRRLWRKGQIGAWTEDGTRVIVSEYSKKDKCARIVAVDLARGRESVLFSEPIAADQR